MQPATQVSPEELVIQALARPRKLPPLGPIPAQSAEWTHALVHQSPWQVSPVLQACEPQGSPTPSWLHTRHLTSRHDARRERGLVPAGKCAWQESMHDALPPHVSSQFLRFWQSVSCEHMASGIQQLVPAHWSHIESEALIEHPPGAVPPSTPVPPPPPVLPAPTDTDVHPESPWGTQSPSSGGCDAWEEHASAPQSIARAASVDGCLRRILRHI